jgi:hypothetical protein
MLLSVLALGFAQGLYAPDVADGNVDDGFGVRTDPALNCSTKRAQLSYANCSSIVSERPPHPKNSAQCTGELDDRDVTRKEFEGALRINYLSSTHQTKIIDSSTQRYSVCQTPILCLSIPIIPS